MSSRIHLSTTPGRIADTLGVLTLSHELRAWLPRYNIVPGQSALIVRTIEGVNARPPVTASTKGKPLGGRPVEVAPARWGLVPRWAGEPDIGIRTTITRGEEAHERPAFAELFTRRRCLVPVDGLFEWTAARRPVWFGYQDPQLPVGQKARGSGGGGVAMLAGLWDRWEAPDTPDDVPIQARAALDSFTLLSTPGEAPDAAVPVGFAMARMPVVLEPEQFAHRLDPSTDPALVRGLAVHRSKRPVLWYEVGPWVNSPRYDGPKCIEPISALGEGLVTGLFGPG